MKPLYLPIEPFKPHEPLRSEFRLFHAKYDKNIYYDIVVNGDSDYDLDQHFEDYDEERPPIPEIGIYDRLSLQDIVDFAPEGTRLCDIILKIEIPRHLNYTEVSFDLFNRDLEQEEKAYQKAIEKYNQDMIEYEKDLIKYNEDKKLYDEASKQIQIKKLEDQLNELKKK